MALARHAVFVASLASAVITVAEPRSVAHARETEGALPMSVCMCVCASQLHALACLLVAACADAMPLHPTTPCVCVCACVHAYDARICERVLVDCDSTLKIMGWTSSRCTWGRTHAGASPPRATPAWPAV
jgi:hypothetical protein